MPAMDRLGPTMLNLLACASAAFEAAEDVEAPAVQHLVPGSEVAWDNCCEGGGQLYVRAISVNASGSPFPQPALVTAGCGPMMWAAHIAVGTIRCAHTVDENGAAPTADELTDDTLAMTTDMAILEAAIRCCFEDAPGVMKAVIEQWTPQPTSGGCWAQEWTLYVGYGACDPCTEPEPAPDNGDDDGD